MSDMQVGMDTISSQALQILVKCVREGGIRKQTDPCPNPSNRFLPS